MRPWSLLLATRLLCGKAPQPPLQLLLVLQLPWPPLRQSEQQLLQHQLRLPLALQSGPAERLSC